MTPARYSVRTKTEKARSLKDLVNCAGTRFLSIPHVFSMTCLLTFDRFLSEIKNKLYDWLKPLWARTNLEEAIIMG